MKFYYNNISDIGLVFSYQTTSFASPAAKFVKPCQWIMLGLKYIFWGPRTPWSLWHFILLGVNSNDLRTSSTTNHIFYRALGWLHCPWCKQPWRGYCHQNSFNCLPPLEFRAWVLIGCFISTIYWDLSSLCTSFEGVWPYCGHLQLHLKTWHCFYVFLYRKKFNGHGDIVMIPTTPIHRKEQAARGQRPTTSGRKTRQSRKLINFNLQTEWKIIWKIMGDQLLKKIPLN